MDNRRAIADVVDTDVAVAGIDLGLHPKAEGKVGSIHLDEGSRPPDDAAEGREVGNVKGGASAAHGEECREVAAGGSSATLDAVDFAVLDDPC